jgi:hypothetical protein
VNRRPTCAQPWHTVANRWHIAQRRWHTSRETAANTSFGLGASALPRTSRRIFVVTTGRGAGTPDADAHHPAERTLASAFDDVDSTEHVLHSARLDGTHAVGAPGSPNDVTRTSVNVIHQEDNVVRVLLIAAAIFAGCTPPPAPLAPPPALKADITWLASPLLDGRATGSAGNDSAALYIARTYAALNLAGAFPTTSCEKAPCRTLYDQLFFPPPDVLKDAGIREDAAARNVAAIVPGSDPALAGEYIVVGAHFDHLNHSGYGALDRQSRLQPHLGADDNASGTAAVLELARRLSLNPVRRSVLLVNFGSEELGLFGSAAFVKRSPVQRDSIVAMLNIDMVGRLRRERVYVYGLASSPQWKRLLDRANLTTRLWTDVHDELGEDGTGSDHENFSKVGIPAVHFTTGIHPDWHTANDKANRLDLPGEMRVIALIENLVRFIGDSTAVIRPGRR